MTRVFTWIRIGPVGWGMKTFPPDLPSSNSIHVVTFLQEGIRCFFLSHGKTTESGVPISEESLHSLTQLCTLLHRYACTDHASTKAVGYAQAQI